MASRSPTWCSSSSPCGWATCRRCARCSTATRRCWTPTSAGTRPPRGSTACRWSASSRRCTRAAFNGDAALAGLLLGRRADTEARTPAGQTPLHIAVSVNQPAIVGLLLAAGADPNSATGQGLTPLHFAVMRDRREIAGRLLDAGADPARPTCTDGRRWTGRCSSATRILWSCCAQECTSWTCRGSYSLRQQGTLHFMVTIFAPTAKIDTTQIVSTALPKATSDHMGCAAVASNYSSFFIQERRFLMNKQTNGTAPVGDALLGRAINVAGEPIDGGEPLADLRWLPIDRPASAGHPAPDGQMLTTGIKVIDLHAPIVRGGTIPMIAVPGTGMIVSSTELIQASRRTRAAAR